MDTKRVYLILHAFFIFLNMKARKVLVSAIFHYISLLRLLHKSYFKINTFQANFLCSSSFKALHTMSNISALSLPSHSHAKLIKYRWRQQQKVINKDLKPSLSQRRGMIERQFIVQGNHCNVKPFTFNPVDKSYCLRLSWSAHNWIAFLSRISMHC